MLESADDSELASILYVAERPGIQTQTGDYRQWKTAAFSPRELCNVEARFREKRVHAAAILFAQTMRAMSFVLLMTLTRQVAHFLVHHQVADG